MNPKERELARRRGYNASRVTRVFTLRARPAAVHAIYDTILHQAWCGSRAQFRHKETPGTAADVTCEKCLARIRAGAPLARRS